MAAFLHTTVVALAIAYRCDAIRNEDEEKSDRALHMPAAQVLSVTESGHFVAHGSHVLAGLGKNVSSIREQHHIAKHHATSSVLSVDEVVVGRARRKKSGRKRQRNRDSRTSRAPQPKPKADEGNTAKADEGKAQGKGTDDAGKNKEEDAGKTKEAEGNEPEEQDKPHNLTRFEKIMLDVGWLGCACAIVVVLLLLDDYWPYNLFITADHESAKALADKGDAPSEGNASARYMYEAMWGVNEISFYVSWFIAIQAFVNFLCFAMATEVAFLEREGVDAERFLYLGESLKEWVPKTNFLVQNVTAVILIIFVLVRCIGAMAHPVWSRYGSMAPLVFLLGDFYTHVEIASVIPTFIDDITGKDRFMNLTWISLLRTVEIMFRHGSLGQAFQRMTSLRDEWILIRMVLGYSLLLWIMMSGLFYSENWDNTKSVWEAAKYNGEDWQRYGSIPSSMWFTMVSLSCEWPLADVFDGDHPVARLIAMACAFIGVPLWAVPSGIVGSALQEKVTAGDDEDDDQPVQTYPPPVQTYPPPVQQGEQQVVPGNGEETALHRAWTVFVFFASFGSVFVFFLWTASRAAHRGELHEQKEVVILWVHVNITDAQLAFVDGAVAAIFAIHMGYEVHQRYNQNQEEHQPYFHTVHFVGDLFSWIPGLLHLIVIQLCGMELPVLLADLLRGACVFRLLKPDRYICAFKEWFSIMYEQKSILQATGYVSFMLLVIISTAFYYTEWDNPDGELREYYGSAARALWSGLINLHGEWPWCDYSALGKAIGVLVNLAGIAICMVPIAIFADGYADRLSIDDEESSLSQQTWEKKCRPNDEGTLQKIYDNLYSHLHVDYRLLTPSYRWIRAISVSMSVMSSLTTIALTLGRFDDKDKNAKLDDHITIWLWVFYVIDLLSTSFFIIELILRIVATKGMYILSVTGICDILSIVSLVTSLTPMRSESLHPNYVNERIIDDMVVPGRLLRCFCLDNYLHFNHTLASIMRLNWKPMCKSLYCLVCLWFMFATCLYFTERPHDGVKEKSDPKIDGTHSEAHEEEDGDDDLTMEQRYSDILTALQYALVHITGDYPITNYKLQSMPFHFVFVISGMIVIGAFSGIFSAGFQNFLEAENHTKRREAAQKRLDALAGTVIFLQYKFRRMRKGRLAATMGGEAYLASQAATANPKAHPFQFIRDIVQRKTEFGMMFMFCCNAALIINLTCVFLGSIDEIDDKVPATLDSIMASTSIVFFVEYAMRLLAGRPPFSNVFHLMRIIDLICLLPAILLLFQGTIFEGKKAKAKEEYEKWIDCLKLIRLVRILDFPIVSREVGKTVKTFRRVAGVLLMPTVLGINIWLFSSTVFMWVEHRYKGASEPDMETVPDAMYYCSFFILGEWANVDFSFGAGSRVCIFYCLVGIMIFAIPVGIISSSVEDSMKQLVEDQQELSRLYGLGKGITYDDKAQSPPNLGAPMIPGQIGGSTSTPPGANNRDNFYMPRYPEQESVRYVPRPPGRLAPPPPVAVQLEGGNPMIRPGGPVMGMAPMSQPLGGQLPGMPPMGMQPPFQGGGPPSGMQPAFQGGRPPSAMPQQFQGGGPPSGMPQQFQGGGPLGGLPPPSSAPLQPPGAMADVGAGFWGPRFPGVADYQPPGSVHGLPGLPPPSSALQPPGSFHGAQPPGGLPPPGSFHGLPPPGSMPAARPLQGLPPPGSLPPLQGLPPPGRPPY